MVLLFLYWIAQLVMLYLASWWWWLWHICGKYPLLIVVLGVLCVKVHHREKKCLANHQKGLFNCKWFNLGFVSTSTVILVHLVYSIWVVDHQNVLKIACKQHFPLGESVWSRIEDTPSSFVSQVERSGRTKCVSSPRLAREHGHSLALKESFGF